MNNRLEDHFAFPSSRTQKHLVADQKIPAGRGSNPCAPTIITFQSSNRLTNMLMLGALLNMECETYA